MKKFLTLSLLLFAAFTAADAQCKAKELVKKWKGDLSPFGYDSFIVDDFQYSKEKQVLDMEFTALSGLDYKLIFCTNNIPQPLGITIYDKPKTDKKRKIIYFDESSKDGFLCSFRAEKTGTYYIEYEVPIGNQMTMNTKGCVLMLIGISSK
jgi:hypothetical protein